MKSHRACCRTNMNRNIMLIYLPGESKEQQASCRPPTGQSWWEKATILLIFVWWIILNISTVSFDLFQQVAPTSYTIATLTTQHFLPLLTKSLSPSTCSHFALLRWCKLNILDFIVTHFQISILFLEDDIYPVNLCMRTVQTPYYLRL